MKEYIWRLENNKYELIESNDVSNTFINTEYEKRLELSNAIKEMVIIIKNYNKFLTFEKDFISLISNYFDFKATDYLNFKEEYIESLMASYSWRITTDEYIVKCCVLYQDDGQLFIECFDYKINKENYQDYQLSDFDRLRAGNDDIVFSEEVEKKFINDFMDERLYLKITDLLFYGVETYVPAKIISILQEIYRHKNLISEYQRLIELYPEYTI